MLELTDGRPAGPRSARGTRAVAAGREGCRGNGPHVLTWGFSEGSRREGVCALCWAGGQGPCCHIRETECLPLCLQDPRFLCQVYIHIYS